MIAGNLWQVKCALGDSVTQGDVLVIIEAMKMEIPLLAPCSGVIESIRGEPGSSVRAGQCVVVMSV